MPEPGPSLTLAVDIGTSSVRSALFNERLQRVGASLAQRSYQVAHGDDGRAELDPATVLRELRHCLDETLTRVGRRQVRAVGVSCFWHSLVGVDARGNLLTPIFTWADSRCRDDVAHLRVEMAEDEYHARTGCMLRASYWPAKLRWLARTRRGLFRRIAKWVSPAEWLQNHFCAHGLAKTAHGMATGTGLYDPNALGWNEDLIRRCGLRRDQLPEINNAPLMVREEIARAYPALANARWYPAIGDGAASNLGSGATRTGYAAINVGTSAAFRVMRHGAMANAPFGLFCYRVDTERYLVGGAVSNAGNLRAWCLRQLRLPGTDGALDQALAARPEPVQSLVVLPFWTAERAPTWCENLAGVICGLNQNTSALDVLQATTEAVYHRLALIADLSLAHTARAATRILVSGGILKSAHLLQRLADVLGRPVHRCAEREASLRGAAVYAAEKEGLEKSLHIHAVSEGAAVRPRARIARLYARERARQQALESLLSTSVPD